MSGWLHPAPCFFLFPPVCLFLSPAGQGPGTTSHRLLASTPMGLVIQAYSLSPPFLRAMARVKYGQGYLVGMKGLLRSANMRLFPLPMVSGCLE